MAKRPSLIVELATLRRAALALALAATLPAHAGDAIGDAFREGTPVLDVRGRFVVLFGVCILAGHPWWAAALRLEMPSVSQWLRAA